MRIRWKYYREREEEKEEINEEKKITHKVAIASYDNFFKYLEDFNDKDLNILLNLKEKLDFIKSVKSVQTDLTNFVINTFAYKYNFDYNEFFYYFLKFVITMKRIIYNERGLTSPELVRYIEVRLYYH